MDSFNIFLPFLPLLILMGLTPIVLFLIKILAGISRILLFHKFHPEYEAVGISRVFGLNRTQVENLFIFSLLVVFFMVMGWIFACTSSFWIRATPSEKWEQDLNRADTVIAFGFGMEKGPGSQEKPGSANIFLYEWILDNTNAGTIIAQEGIVLAHQERNLQKASPKTGTRKIISMHLHRNETYVNTIEAADYALKKVLSLEKAKKINSKIIVVAHNMQLQRASWDLQKLAKMEPLARKFQFIIPDIPRTPFPENSIHLHTRFGFIYNLIELYLLRPRDYFWCFD